MADVQDAFAQFEHEGWQQVAGKYDSTWSALTRQFIPHLLEATQIAPGMQILDVCCGPGYVSAAVRERGAIPTGIDFSTKMIAIATRLFPGVDFAEGDAQKLPFANATFDRVLMNFGLLHLSQPDQACAEACRVLRAGGKFGFTIWAEPHENPGGKIVNDAVEAYGDLDVDVPEGPSKFLYAEKQECRKTLQESGFDGDTLIFQTRLAEWNLATPRFLFDAEHEAGVRTAGVLKRQSPERLDAIQQAIERGVKSYARDDGFAVPFAAHVIVVTKAL
jgi:ubiquinone/menaquinone biosynthesis C-methylase UbiE